MDVQKIDARMKSIDERIAALQEQKSELRRQREGVEQGLRDAHTAELERRLESLRPLAQAYNGSGSPPSESALCVLFDAVMAAFHRVTHVQVRFEGGMWDNPSSANPVAKQIHVDNVGGKCLSIEASGAGRLELE